MVAFESLANIYTKKFKLNISSETIVLLLKSNTEIIYVHLYRFQISKKYTGLILSAAITPQGDARRIAILIYGLVSFPKNTPLTRTYIKCSFSLERLHSGSSPELTYDE